MSLVSTICASCGAENLGTKFCESCGAAAEIAPIPVAASPALHASQATGGVGATPVRVFGLIFFLLAHTLPDLLEYAVYNSTAYLPELGRGSAVALISLAGLFALIAALAGRAGGGGKAFGALLAITYSGLGIFILYGGVRDFDGYTNDVLLALSYFAFFLSWALGRPFRGPGYFGLLLMLVVGVLGALIEFIPGVRNNYLGFVAIEGVVFALSVWLIVGLCLAFEGKPRVMPGSTPAVQLGPGQSPTANQSARLALIFALTAIGLQVVSYPLTALGLYFVSLITSPLGLVLLILAIVFGHLGRVQTRRTGQTGAGQALAALIISYGIIGIGIIAIVIQLLTIAAISTSFYGE